jgi:sugar lactone lactonase YvrE
MRKIARCALGLGLLLACGEPTPVDPAFGRGGSAGDAGQTAGAGGEGDGGAGARGGGACDSENDAENCGLCGRSCNGAECSSGMCATTELYEPGSVDNGIDLAIDAAHVYWTDALGRVQSVAKNGGEPSIVASDGDRATGLVVDSDRVYWVNTFAQQIRSTALDGSDGQTIDVGARPLDLLATPGDSFFYFVTADSGDLRRVARAENAADEVLDVGSPTGMQLDGNGDYVFFTCRQAGEVRRWDKLDESVSTLADAQANPSAISLQGERIYWVNEESTTASVMSAALDGSDARVLAAVSEPSRVATDGVNVYFTTRTDVRRTSAEGSDELVLGGGYDFAGAIAVDESSVFWADFGNGHILKVAK